MARSAKPFRAQRAEVKYSKTERPSRKLDLTGRGTMLPEGSVTKPRIAESCLICSAVAREPPESEITLMEFERGKLFHVKSASSLVTESQTSCERRFSSSSVIRPILKFFSIDSISFSAFWII